MTCAVSVYPLDAISSREMTSTGTAFSAAAPAARDPTVTCVEKSITSATSAAIDDPVTRMSVVFGCRPGAATRSSMRSPCTAVCGTFSVYRPFASVVAVAADPATVTIAPGTATPSARVVTTPDTVNTSCADAARPSIRHRHTIPMRRAVFIVIVRFFIASPWGQHA